MHKRKVDQKASKKSGKLQSTNKKGIVKKLSLEERTKLKEQRAHMKEITAALANIGFVQLQGIDGKEINYDGRTTEMDDVFILENVVLVVEYTIGDPGTHLLKKKIFYDKVLENKRAFLEFVKSEKQLKPFGNAIRKAEGNYSLNEIQLAIVYCSKKDIKSEHRHLVPGINFFDYNIVKYFTSLAKVIKKSSKYEFFDFLNIPFNKIGENIKASAKGSSAKFSGHILPEEKSAFQQGYKIVTFYIDAESLLRRSFVLRQNSWRELENIGHYQRMFLPKKIIAMRKYLAEKGRVFINNIIVSIETDKIKLYNENREELKLLADGQFNNSSPSDVTPASIEINDEANIIGIIDGQHRTFAYHEGIDGYEKTISRQRKIQNLLVTGILFPSNEPAQKRLKFEANLFMEINSNQAKANPQLLQEIELMINPMSSISIGKKILQGLNKNGPLNNRIEQYWYEKGKLKTASIVSYGLRPLIKLDDVKSRDSLFSVWKNSDKKKLKSKDSEDFALLDKYIAFAVEKIRDILIAFKANMQNGQWNVNSTPSDSGVVSVTFINGVLNALRLVIERTGNCLSQTDYVAKLQGIDKFPFKTYKSSQYRKMGEDIYKEYLAEKSTLPNV